MAERRAEAVRLRRFGYTEAEIATELGVSLATVQRDMGLYRKALHERALRDAAAWRLEVTELITQLLRESKSAWEKSLQDEESHTVGVQGGADEAIDIRKTRSRSGDAAHMANMLRAAERLIDLWGLKSDSGVSVQVGGPAEEPFVVVRVDDREQAGDWHQVRTVKVMDPRGVVDGEAKRVGFAPEAGGGGECEPSELGGAVGGESPGGVVADEVGEVSPPGDTGDDGDIED